MILTGSATNVTSTLNRATRVRVGATNAGTTIAAATGTFNAQFVAGATVVTVL